MPSLKETRRGQWILSACDEPVLEVGCDKGDLFRGSMFSDVTMLDKEEHDTPYPFKKGDAHDLPFDDSSFNSVVLAEILEHLRNPIRALKEARRVTADRVIITVPDEHHWARQAKPFQNPKHRRYYTGKKLGDQLGLVFDRCSIGHLEEPPYFSFWTGSCKV